MNEKVFSVNNKSFSHQPMNLVNSLKIQQDIVSKMDNISAFFNDATSILTSILYVIKKFDGDQLLNFAKKLFCYSELKIKVDMGNERTDFILFSDTHFEQLDLLTFYEIIYLL